MSTFTAKPKIEIYGLTSTTRTLGVDSNASFTVGETIRGASSNATASVEGFYSEGSDQYLLINNLEGDFDTIEGIIGSLGGTTRCALGTATKRFLTIPYVNADYGINETWTIGNDLLLSIEDSVKKIDITRGGNFATGYTFGFSLSNISLVKDIINAGVFLENLPVKYFIDFGAGFEVVWSGILDSIPKIGTVDVKFSCIDSMKIRSNKIGSEKIPICLNQNYNCKAIAVDYEDGLDYEEDIIKRYLGLNIKYVDYGFINYKNKKINEDGSYSDTDANLNHIVLSVYFASDWYGSLATLQDGMILTVMAGSGASEVFTIINIQRGPDMADFRTFNAVLDKSTDSIVTLDELGPPGIIQKEFSLIRLSIGRKRYLLSNNDISYLHTGSTIHEKQPRIIENEEKFYLEKYKNYGFTDKHIDLIGFDNDLGITSIESTTLPTNISTLTGKTDTFGFSATCSFQLNSLIIKETSEYKRQINLGRITFNFNNHVPLFSPSTVVANVQLVGIYSPNTYYSIIQSSEFLNENIEGKLSSIGNNLIFTPSIGLNSLILNNIYDVTLFSSVSLRINISASNLISSSTYFLTSFDIDKVEYRILKTAKIDDDNLGFGCTGENVDVLATKFKGYPDTIKYIDTTYNNRDISDINTQSFIDSEDEFQNYPSFTFRNPAHQIIGQSEYNDILKELLYFSHLGLFPDRDDKITIVNWLWKSRVFSDTSPIDRYNEEFYESISDIKRPLIIKAASDYELRYNFEESIGEYTALIRIKNTDQDAFDFDRDTEGVSSVFRQEAEQAWELLRAGYLRTKKITGTIEESKWIKTFYDSAGESEAINFIRNQAGHINRGQETASITVQLNTNEAIKELLSFDSVYHLKKTDGIERSGWLVESRISWKSKTVTLTYLLDISPKDPFLYRIGNIQDNGTVDDIIVNDTLSLDIIEDGRGVL